MNKAKVSLGENVYITVTGENGKTKMLFYKNALGKFVEKVFGISPSSPLFWTANYKLTLSNLVTDSGRSAIASRLNGDGNEAVFNYIGLGSGTNTPANADTTLQTEITTNGLQRKVATATRKTTGSANDTAVLTALFTSSGTATVNEAGVFNASSAGTMLARVVFPTVNLIAGDTLSVSWSFDID